MPQNASQLAHAGQHFSQPRPLRVKAPRFCALSRSHAPQSGPKYPLLSSHASAAPAMTQHSSLKHVCISVLPSTAGLSLTEYHASAWSASVPPVQSTPRAGHGVHGASASSGTLRYVMAVHSCDPAGGGVGGWVEGKGR